MPALCISVDRMDLQEVADCRADGNGVMHRSIWCHFAAQANSVIVPGVDSGEACQYRIIHQPFLGIASCRFSVSSIYEPRGTFCDIGITANSMGMSCFADRRFCESVM